MRAGSHSMASGWCIDGANLFVAYLLLLAVTTPGGSGLPSPKRTSTFWRLWRLSGNSLRMSTLNA